MSKRLRLNHQIKVPEVRVIDESGNQIGVVKTSEALRLAQEKELDLIEVSPVAQPPVCRIMNYGAYQYQQDKKERKQRAKQKKVEVKGIRLTLKIGPNDLETRKKQALKFLEKSHKVRIELILKGREKAFFSRARELMQNFADSLSETSNLVVEKELTKQGGRLSMIVGRK